MKRASAILLLATLGTALAPAPTFGQQRVRLTLPRDTLVGFVTRMSADEVELELADGGSQSFLREDVLRMERGTEYSQGHAGYLVASLAGFGITFGLLSSPRETLRDWGGILYPLATIGGGVAGYLIGSSKKLVRWKTVPGWTVYWMMPERSRDHAATRNGGTGLRVGVRVRF